MKIKNITLRGYKKFIDDQTFSFMNPDGDINDMTLLVGNNGSGKSSILQAIVMLVAGATRDRFDIQNLDWPGFEYRFLQSGRMPIEIKAEIVFDDVEIKATKDYAQKLREIGKKLGGVPSEKVCVQLHLDHEKGKVLAGNLSEYNQFSGYQYAKQLASLTPNKIQLFKDVGNIYWYSEQRNSYSITNLEKERNEDKPQNQLDDIRNFLANAYSYHLAVRNGQREIKEGEFDFYAKLDELYSKVFVGRKFVGSAPRFDIYEKSSAPDFFISDGHNQYELSGMSAGERAIFPILMDFARWNINNSIIIIDELELHLHPPLQQQLVRVLSNLGNNNQFIFTTHSNSVATMFDESQNQIIRL